MRWKDALALITIVFADSTHDLVTEIGDWEQEGLLQGVSFASPLCSQPELRRTYDGLPRVTVID